MTCLGLRLEDGVPVYLRGSLDRTVFLTVGDSIEIILGREHVEALRDQATAALGDMSSVEAAEGLLSDTFEAGVQARTAAERALAQVEVAERAGAVEQAEAARVAARVAIEAADHAKQAVRDASAAMESAEEAAEGAVRAANVAKAAGEAVVDGSGAGGSADERAADEREQLREGPRREAPRFHSAGGV